MFKLSALNVYLKGYLKSRINKLLKKRNNKKITDNFLLANADLLIKIDSGQAI